MEKIIDEEDKSKSPADKDEKLNLSTKYYNKKVASKSSFDVRNPLQTHVSWQRPSTAAINPIKSE